MSAAPTPAPHTPVIFVKAGGAGFFSDRCKALLAKFGYEPEDFGTYDQVRERLHDARAKVAAHDNPQPGVPPGPAPTARERELGQPLDHPDHYQAGHLSMNTCRQGQRDNPCSNVVDGYDMGLAPCMPHQGSATDPGSEHNRWTVREIDDPMNRPGAEPGGRYPPGAMDADADARAQALLRERGEVPQATSDRPTEAAAKGQAGVGAVGDQANFTPTSSKAGDADSLPPEARVDGETAEECISNFRKRAEADLKEHVSKQETIAENRQVAGSQADRDAAKADAQTKRQELEAKEAELSHAQSSLGGYRSAVTRAQDSAGGVPTEAQAARIQDAQAKADARAADVARLQAERDALAGPAGTAQARSTRMQNANCLANQGQRIADGNGRDDGRYPRPWDDLPRTSAPTGAADQGQE